MSKLITWNLEGFTTTYKSTEENLENDVTSWRQRHKLHYAHPYSIQADSTSDPYDEIEKEEEIVREIIEEVIIPKKKNTRKK